MLLDNIIVRALSRVFDLILLNILWLLCSVPFITIGASTTALYSVMLKIAANEEGYIIRGFWTAFKKNFKQSTLVWLILLTVGAVLGMDIMIISGKLQGVLLNAGLLLIGIVSVIYLIELAFVFPIIAKFENSTLNIMKNAVLIPLTRLPFMLPILILTAACLILTFINQTTIMAGAVIWSVIGAALLAFANSFLIREMFKPFVRNEE